MRRLPFGGLVGATVFFAASMSPSLMPRHWLFQAIVTGIVTAAGYGLGIFATHVWRRLQWREPGPLVKRTAWRLLAVLGPVAVVVMTIRGVGWQQELHRLMGMPVPSGWSYAPAVIVALILASALVAVSRGIRWIARLITNLLDRWMSRRVAGMVGAAIVAFLVVGTLNGIVGPALFSAADQTFRVSDGIVADDVTPPASTLRSGSSASLFDWNDLGSQGRTFVTGGPTKSELADFAEGPATAPIRIYAGLASEARIRDRAAAAIEELERTGAFDRAVLCVMTTTGTGWVDPRAASTLEYIWAGDTALVTMQYSYLPSWLSFLVDSDRARRAGAELFNAIYDRWAELPEADRPLLLVFGESLGVHGGEGAFSGIADLRNRTDGVLWVGPPRFSSLWSAFTARRDPETPERLPIYDGGATVRFVARPADLDRPEAPWTEPRVVYLQHASDPIVWWSPRLILRRPSWLEERRGSDVLPSVRWFPLVTFWQLTADMAVSTRVPAGHGHDYGALVANAWAAVAPPPDWTEADTGRLRDLLAPQDG